MSINRLPQRYRSRYTGSQIDELLATVPLKLGSEVITTDVNNGDSDRVPAASITKYLNEKIQQLNDPNYLLEIWSKLPDNNQFTDAYMDKLNRLNEQFKGSYLNEVIRSETLDTKDFLGGEITFIINAGDGISRFDYFDTSTRRWIPTKFVADGSIDEVDVPVPASISLVSFDARDISCIKFFVKGMERDRLKMVEATVSCNKKDTFMTLNSVCGTRIEDPFELFFLSVEYDAVNFMVHVFIVTRISNTKISGKVYMEV